jgi:hypothetical protein
MPMYREIFLRSSSACASEVYFFKAARIHEFAMIRFAPLMNPSIELALKIEIPIWRLEFDSIDSIES